MTEWFIFGGALVVLALVCWPQRGLAARWKQARQLAARSQREDLLKHILKCEANARAPTIESIAGALQIAPSRVTDLLEEMADRGLLAYDEGQLRLKPAGRRLALHIIRAHRLWESYLADQTGVAEVQWHPRAERQEHLISPQEANALAAQLGHPTHDPHGDAIPGASGDLAAEGGMPLQAASPDTPVLITHIEDEPETIYAQLTAQGLRAGMRACIVEKSPNRIRFWADGNEHVLAPVLANNIAVRPLPEARLQDLLEEEFLSGLRPAQRAKVLGLSPACRGPERRRLLDLGFVPGTPVEVEMVSPGGDPTAYRVRGTVVALRRDQAGLIRIATEGTGKP